jgi:protein-tyrosine phosphatase
MPTLIDTHCHLLPGLDDGPKNMSAALRMAWMAVEDGVRTVVATPHQLGMFARNNTQRIEQQAAELRRVLETEDAPLRIVTGAEVRVDPDLAGKLRRGEATAIGQGRYVLVELPPEVYVPIERLLVDLAGMGRQIVLAHPERHPAILARPQMLAPLIEAGCIVQITAGSLLGAFGLEVRRFAETLLARGQVHLVASDAHSAVRRRPVLGQAFHYLCRIAGRRTAETLCATNPAALIEGADLELPTPGQKSALRALWTAWSKAG